MRSNGVELQPWHMEFVWHYERKYCRKNIDMTKDPIWLCCNKKVAIIQYIGMAIFCP